MAMAPQWVELFDEYEQGSTEEAKFVKQLDKLDMGMQAILYQRQQDLSLDEFILSAKSKIDDTTLRQQLE